MEASGRRVRVVTAGGSDLCQSAMRRSEDIGLVPVLGYHCAASGRVNSWSQQRSKSRGNADGRERSIAQRNRRISPNPPPLNAVADEKQYLRDILSEARSSLSAIRAAALSARVQRRLLSSEAYLAASKVVLYAPLGREVETGLIAADALRSRRQLYYPIADRTSPDKARRRYPTSVNCAPALSESWNRPPPERSKPRRLGPGAGLRPGIAFTAAGARAGPWRWLLRPVPRRAPGRGGDRRAGVFLSVD